MLTRRIIPCLDVKGGKVVKGTNFVNLKYAGDAVSLAKKYCDDGADELVFLDITATKEKRPTVIEMIKKVALEVFIPFTVGGGVRSVDDMRQLLCAGADKISVNSAAVRNPGLIRDAATVFGSQCVVVAIDAKRCEDGFEVYVSGGSKATGIDALSWVRRVEKLGAGEILLTSMDADGTKEGFDLELTKLVSEAVNIPVIASGGAGNLDSFVRVFSQGKADAALAASVFHYGKYTVRDVKKYLAESWIEVRK
ncbi:MAG: imidazole glycerol phosphate synthase subunit HisF [archaeon]